MAKYKTVPLTVDAIQFTGANKANIQNIAGTRSVDPGGKYLVPNFDDADSWQPDRADKTVVAVINLNGEWKGVKIGDWLVRDSTGAISIYPDAVFKVSFVAA